MAVRNKELYDFILNKYINTTNPITQQEIADKFNCSIGHIKNFMYRHDLNKKNYYLKRNKEIKKLFEKGLSVKQISKLHDLKSQQVYLILKED